MAGYKPVKGDRVRVVIESEVTWTGKDGAFDIGEESYVSAVDINKIVSVEKIEPPVTVFKPGDVVRSKSMGLVYSLGEGGYIAHRSGRWMSYSRTATQPSSWHSGDYEKVSLD